MRVANRLPSDMSAEDKAQDAGEALLDVDHDVHELVQQTPRSGEVKLLGKLSDIGDQPQMRTICGVLIAAAVVRRDPRMLAAGIRMLASHEVATAAKTAIKDRVRRRRPRSAENKEQEVPHKGGRPDKEESSFPSGHSAGALAVASAYSSVYPKQKAPALLGAAAVAIIQVPRRAHYVTDVAAGLAIGAASNLAVGLCWKVVRLGASRLLRG